MVSKTSQNLKIRILLVRQDYDSYIAYCYGIIIVRPEDVRDFLYPLNVSKISGIGEKNYRGP